MRIPSSPQWAPLRVVAVFGLFFFIPATAVSTVSAQGAQCVVSEGVVQTGDVITGTSDNDVIDCTSATTNKSITGGDGNDTITGGLGNDYIDGGAGNDTITGGPANDCLYGREGNDTLTGSEGSNTIDPGAGENTVSDNTDPNGAITGCTTSTTPLPTATIAPTTAPLPTATIAPTTAPLPTATVAPTAISLPTGVATDVPSAEATVSPTADGTISEPGGGPILTDITTASPRISGGSSSTGTVTISAPAGDGGTTILLGSDSASAGVADSVLVLEGDTTAVFEIGTAPVTQTTLVTVSATLNENTVSTVLEIVRVTNDAAPSGTENLDTNTGAESNRPSDDSGDVNTTGNTFQPGGTVASLPSTGDGSGIELELSTLTLLIGAVTLSVLVISVTLSHRRVD